MTQARTALLLLGLVTLLGACAPSASTERLSVGSVPELTTFHPMQSGLQWEYLYENDALDAQRITHRVTGPISENGRTLIAEHTYGRGFDHRYYREHTMDGVFLHREDRPGVTLTYDPPIHELPTALNMTTGARWDGTTTVTIEFDNAPDATEQHTLEYQYIVQEQRRVSLPDRPHDVFVLDFQSRDDAGQRVIQQLWYEPFLGYVKMRDGAVLVRANTQGGGF